MTYETLAPEYYDEARHPTSANFATASRKIIATWLDACLSLSSNDWICEVGPGRSILADLLVDRGHGLRRLTLVDSSLAMLSYSLKWITSGAHLFQASADRLPFASGSIGVVVASLGDPYNAEVFWSEARRVLRPGGEVIFTTPSYEWSEAFRQGNQHAMDVADFDLADGRLVSVPSYIVSEEQQLAIIRRAGFDGAKVVNVTPAELDSNEMSPKIMVETLGDRIPMVTGFRAAVPFS